MSDSKDSIITYNVVSSPYVEDDILPAEEQPLPVAASPTAESPSYINDSDHEDDPEEDPEDDPDEDPTDYPADGGEEGDDEDELMAIPTLQPSPLPQIPSPPLPLLSPPPTDPIYKEAPLGYRGSTPAALEIGYGITDTWDDVVGAIQETAPTTVDGVNQRVIELSTTFYQGTSMIYAMIEERQDDKALQRVRVNRLFRDRRFHAHITRLIEGEARASRKAWTQSMDASDAARSGISDYNRDIARGDQGVAGRTPQATGTVHTSTDCTEVMSDSADYSSRTHSDLKDHQSPSTARGTGGGRTTIANPATTTTTTTTSVTDAQIEALIEQGVARALAARDTDRNTNGDDIHNSRTGARRTKRVTHECTYPDFMKCKPMNFKGTEGVFELTQWFEKIETVFRIGDCSVENQINFSTCTLLGSALTWWNSHVTTVGPDAAYAMTWVDMKKKMTDKYCPRGEMKKLESELWNLRVKSNDVGSYNQRFQELALLYVRMFPGEVDKIKRYVGGLSDVIHGSVVASRPKTMQEAIEMENELIDKRNNSWAER
nr:reverse transcriptase domain-containing protein [Tanacetum cinerariifolium]